MATQTDTNKVIQVYIENHYGTPYNYVKDEAQAEALEALTKKKTLDRYDFRALEKLGYTIELVMSPNLSLNTIK
tara:strand:- start:1040 stop:1261 length:222 start_codon:yes stop_codon:yes gene_type:complete